MELRKTWPTKTSTIRPETCCAKCCVRVIPRFGGEVQWRGFLTTTWVTWPLNAVLFSITKLKRREVVVSWVKKVCPVLGPEREFLGVLGGGRRVHTDAPTPPSLSSKQDCPLIPSPGTRVHLSSCTIGHWATPRLDHGCRTFSWSLLLFCWIKKRTQQTTARCLLVLA